MRGGFTLFELILSVALAATLLALIGTSINLYLTRVESDRSRVEEVQLARSVLTMIADDLRLASVYQKQDMTSVAKLMAAATPFNVDSIDAARQVGGSGTAAAANIPSLSSGSSSSSGSGSGSSASGSATNQEPEDTMPLGVNGATDQLYVDVTRMPRQEELFGTTTGYTNAQSQASTKSGTSTSSATSDAMPVADLKTVHYFVRQGDAVAPGSAAVTSLAPDAQATAGGLVREEVPRRMRVFGEETGTNSSSNTNTQLVAPEVTQIQFRFYDGSQLTDTWDMKELKVLPVAVEVAVWVKSPRDDAGAAGRMYRQVVSLPMAAISQAAANGGAPGSTSSSTSSATDESTGSSSSSSSGSAFGDQ
jgi:hypothetical protein